MLSPLRLRRLGVRLPSLFLAAGYLKPYIFTVLTRDFPYRDLDPWRT